MLATGLAEQPLGMGWELSRTLLFLRILIMVEIIIGLFLILQSYLIVKMSFGILFLKEAT